jgi:hypothetical protein
MVTMTNQELLNAIDQGLAQISAPLFVHQQIGQIMRQAKELIDKEMMKDQEPVVKEPEPQ